MKCLIENCGREVVSRGLCSACYGRARTLVKSEKVTWEALEQKGLALPSKRVAGDDLFGIAVKEMLAETQQPATAPEVRKEVGAIHPIMPAPIPEPPPVAVPTPAPPAPVPPTLPPALEDPGNAEVMRGVSNAIDEAEFTPPCEPGTKMEIEVSADQPPVPPWER
jgi:hypothetical protein